MPDETAMPGPEETPAPITEPLDQWMVDLKIFERHDSFECPYRFSHTKMFDEKSNFLPGVYSVEVYMSETQMDAFRKWEHSAGWMKVIGVHRVSS